MFSRPADPAMERTELSTVLTFFQPISAVWMRLTTDNRASHAAAYAQTATSLPAIASHFGVTDNSVQDHSNVSLRPGHNGRRVRRSGRFARKPQAALIDHTHQSDGWPRSTPLE